MSVYGNLWHKSRIENQCDLRNRSIMVFPLLLFYRFLVVRVVSWRLVFLSLSVSLSFLSFFLFSVFFPRVIVLYKKSVDCTVCSLYFSTHNYYWTLKFFHGKFGCCPNGKPAVTEFHCLAHSSVAHNTMYACCLYSCFSYFTMSAVPFFFFTVSSLLPTLLYICCSSCWSVPSGLILWTV